MIQIGADTYEDLTPETFNAVLDALERGERPEPGPQSGRRSSEPITGATTLTSPRKDERPEGAPAAGDGSPDSDVDPTSPAARAQHVARPDPRERTDVEATRAAGEAPREATPVAPKPATNGRPSAAPDAPAKQKSATEAGEEPEAPAAPTAPGNEVETKDASAERRDAADRAAPAATRAPDPVTGEEEAEIVPRAASEERKGAARRAAPDAPDSVASERANQAGTRPEGFARGSMDRVDDLQKISGIGPVIERTLHDLGIFSFEQIASWTEENKEWVNAYLSFRGRIDRERWVEQARELIEKERGAPD
jgi:NADH-quinone oxidoreductase subunit E